MTLILHKRGTSIFCRTKPVHCLVSSFFLYSYLLLLLWMALTVTENHIVFIILMIVEIYFPMVFPLLFSVFSRTFDVDLMFILLLKIHAWIDYEESISYPLEKNPLQTLITNGYIVHLIISIVLSTCFNFKSSEFKFSSLNCHVYTVGLNFWKMKYRTIILKKWVRESKPSSETNIFSARSSPF